MEGRGREDEEKVHLNEDKMKESGITVTAKVLEDAVKEALRG